DSVDVEAATAKGIPVTNCPDTFIEEVADHAMRLILATHGRLVQQDRLVREGRWAEGRPMLLQIPRLRGLTLGLVAFGHVARAVAERAKPFGLNVIAYDPFIEEIVMVERGVEPVSLPELLARADIISMHSPATESAQRMIREEHFRQMKKTAIYISTGRGPTTDEQALIKARDDGMIAAAGLDVLEKEPPGGNNRLLKMDNVILTAHVASATARSGRGPAGSLWEAGAPPIRYPDPNIKILDPGFTKYSLPMAAIERIAGGCRFTEGPVWFGDGRYLLFSDSPNDRILKWEEETGAVSVFRQPSNYANGNTRDRIGRLITCEMGSQRLTRTEYDGRITVLANTFDGKRLTGPNDVVVKSDGSIWFSDNGAGIRGNYLGNK